MRVTNILICCSGSVATLKVPEIAVELSKNEFLDFRIICSKASLHFLKNAKLYNPAIWKQFEACGGLKLVFTDEEEWDCWKKIGDSVLHIDLSQWADIVIVAPASADIIAKISSGIADTLLLSVLRAWDFRKPCILCPAMNTMMWCHPVTGKSLEDLKCLGWKVVDPICRTLACNVKGMGAMAHIKDILISIQKAIEIISEKNQNQNQRDSDIFDSKVKKLEDDWREEIKRENAKENYDLFFSIVFSPISVCIVIALLIEFYGKNYFELT